MSDRFDATGTRPGLSNQQKSDPEVIHLKCPNARCKSIRAIKINSQPLNETFGAPHHRTYQCVECKNVWNVSTGGYAAI